MYVAVPGIELCQCHRRHTVRLGVTVTVSVTAPTHSLSPSVVRMHTR